MPFCAEVDSRCATLPGAGVAVRRGERIGHDVAHVTVVFCYDLYGIARPLDGYDRPDRRLDHGGVEGRDALGWSRVARVGTYQIPKLLLDAWDR